MLRNTKKLERIVREYKEFDKGQQEEIETAIVDQSPNVDMLKKIHRDWKIHEYDKLLTEIEKINGKISQLCEIYEL